MLRLQRGYNHGVNPMLTIPREPRDYCTPSRTWSDEDRLRCSAYVVVAAAAFITGFVLGQLSGQAHLGSKTATPSPDSLLPHPRSLQLWQGP
jgi:hypothetical protein